MMHVHFLSRTHTALFVILCVSSAAMAAASSGPNITLDGVNLLIVDQDVTAPGPSASIILKADRIVVLPGVVLRAADGSAGGDAHGHDQPAIASDGGPGGNIILLANVVEFYGFAIAGNGGHGGDAFATGKPAIAKAGDGGPGGMVVGVPEGRYVHGRGGSGGNATAIGEGGACGARGQDARSKGEHASLPQENGEDAEAHATHGEAGCRPGDPGGDGGHAYAFAGDGSGTGRTPGWPGNATAIAGHGGDGGPGGCDEKDLPGGDGGRGGDAYAQGGNISDGVYVQTGGFAAGWAIAYAGTGGNGSEGYVGGRGGDGGASFAYGGSVHAGALTNAASGGGTAGGGGAGGSGGPTCPYPMPLPGLSWLLAAAFVAAGAQTLRGNRRQL